MSASQPPTPVAVFCAFAQPDLSFCLKLEEALKPAQRQHVLTLWHGGHVPVGKDRTQTIEIHFAYEQAEPLYKRALAIREQHLGPQHPRTATSLNNLALLYENQGKYEHAELLLQRALAIS